MITKDNIRIGLDIDGVIAEFWESYLSIFGEPTKDEDITKNVMNTLRHSKDFWVNLPVLRKPDFKVELYCTARVSKKSWTKEFFRNNGFPNTPVYQVWGYGLSKAPKIKGKVDVFIDDSIKNFEDLNKNGIPCLLLSTEINKDYKTEHRIQSLDLDEIFNAYLNLKRWI